MFQFGALRDLLRSHLCPMFPGAIIDDVAVTASHRSGQVSAESPISLLLRPVGIQTFRCRMRRAQPFDVMERDVIEYYVAALGRILDLADRPCFPVLLRRCADEVVARSVRHRGVDDSLVPFLLDTLQDWASQTYEGSRVAAAIAVNPQPPARAISNVHISEFIQKEFSRVLTNGLDSLLVLSASGHVVSHDVLEPPRASDARRTMPFAPLRTHALAQWAEGGRVVFALNRLGEVLVFHNRRLRFARRRGTWFHFPHESVIKRMGRIGNIGLRRAIYETCLDVSFARHGGCIALVKRSELGVFKDRVKEADRLVTADTVKARLLRHCVGKRFDELPRMARLALASVDGAVVVNHDGTVLSAGTIVQIDGGSTGGGRRAAAIALSRAGRALKVSSDGGIICFTDQGSDHDPEIAFEMCTDPM
jgi:hypothetical protein